jgi:hypothetical protein
LSRTLTPTGNPTEPFDLDKECFANPDGPLCSFFCGLDWNQAITECPQRCPSGDSKECPGDWSCYAFTPCLGPGINTPPTQKPTWEPTMHPVSDSPTTKIHYWNEQNKQNSPAPMATESTSTSKPVHALWTASPSFKPTYSPTLDQCRAPSCDNPGECRSGLGFCGTGVVYCNSMSSFKPECIGGVSQLESSSLTPQPTLANKGGPPTISPTTKWQSWVQANYGSDTKEAATAQEHNGDETEASQTTNGNDESGWVGFADTSQPTNKPVTDPFSWASGGTFDGDTYTSYTDSDSPWWSQGQATSDASALSCQITMVVVVVIVAAYKY